MRTVGVRELKAKLSRYLEEVRRGESILVTHRGRVIADIREPTAGSEHLDPFERALLPLVQRGEVRIGGVAAKLKRDIYRPTGLRKQKRLVSRLLRESRDESRS